MHTHTHMHTIVNKDTIKALVIAHKSVEIFRNTNNQKILKTPKKINIHTPTQLDFNFRLLLVNL